jgi:hypothetical protein
MKNLSEYTTINDGILPEITVAVISYLQAGHKSLTICVGGRNGTGHVVLPIETMRNILKWYDSA